jgi:hypothetical protein
MKVLRRFLPLLAALVAATATVGEANAANILYYTDGSNGPDQMLSALNSLPAGYSYTQVSSPGAFQTAIATGTYQLGIYSTMQSFDGSPIFMNPPNDTSALAALATFVQTKGGKAIVNTAINFGTVPLSYAAFGAGFDSGVTYPSPNSIGVTLSKFATGIGGTITNPLTLTQAASPYGSYAVNLTLDPTFGTGAAATYPSLLGNDAIVTGNGGASIVNGFATDVAGTTGKVLYENEIGALVPIASGGPPNGVPEPGTLTLLGLGVAGMTGYARLRRKKGLSSSRDLLSLLK